MKFVLVADTFPPMRTSGAVQLRDLSREFVRQGHDLTVLLPSADISTAWSIESIDGARVVRLRAPRTKDVGYAHRTVSEILMPYAMRFALARSPLAAEKWDGVIWYSPSIFHGPLVYAIKRQSSCPGYLVIRDIFPDWAHDLGLIRPGPTYRFFKHVARRQYDTADMIGVQSSGNLGHFREWQVKGSNRRLEVLQNWLGPVAGKKCSIRLADTPLSGRKVLVYAGNMGVAQGMDIMLDLAGRIKPVRELGFLFVGRGSEVVRLRERATAMNLDNVVFHDEIDPDEVPDLYSQCHVGLIALHSRHRSHNIPGKFLSYLQSGLPVLANVNPGNDIAEIIRQNRIGQVCESDNLDELWQRCLTLVAQTADDMEMKDRCRYVFRDNFSVEAASRQIAGAFTSVGSTGKKD